jgi:hypothetical protein
MKKRVAELTPEEREAQREKWRTDQAQRREEKRKAAYIPTADEWRDEFAATEHYKTLNVHVKQFLAKVEGELGNKVGSLRVQTGPGVYDYFDDDGEYSVDRVARTLLGLKKNWVQEVRGPDGELVAGSYFIDGCSFASDVIESVYRHGLKQSPIFAASFRELLELLSKRYSRQRDQQSAIVRAELAGTYVYEPPALPEPKLEPKPIPQIVEAKPEPVIPEAVRVPIPNVDWPQLNRDLDEKARRYLDGIR